MGAIQDWGKQINWNKRVKAICKPCWELKYCPYGPLVEDFPLKSKNDDHSCRIFGHDCPVFYVAEPFTETKELRNISRNIPRPVQFRVMKRDNQICRVCGQSVKDEDIEFDHIIPFSKGGSSDEHNIRLLCSSCNKKKSNNFEDEYLVRDSNEHFMEPTDLGILELLLDLMDFYHDYLKDCNAEPTLENYKEVFAKDDEPFASILYQVSNDIIKFFKSSKPEEMKASIFKALRYRWGFIDGAIYKIIDASEFGKVDLEKLIIKEKYFVQLLGWNIPLSDSNKKKWKDL